MPDIQSIYSWGGSTDEGYGREVNEDAIKLVDYSNDVSLFIIADGMGSQPSGLQPAMIAINEIESVIRRMFTDNRELLLQEPGVFLREAMLTANRVLGAFVISNEERHSGFGASVSCCLVHGGNAFCFAHCGNTRLYLLREHPQDRSIQMRQLTRDHTKAIRLLDDGIITPEEYHTHPDRMQLASGLGNFMFPEIQVFDSRLKEKDILLMTTDGIHYAIRPDAIAEIVVSSASCELATASLIQAGKMLKYVDNMSAIMIFLTPES